EPRGFSSVPGLESLPEGDTNISVVPSGKGGYDREQLDIPNNNTAPVNAAIRFVVFILTFCTTMLSPSIQRNKRNTVLPAILLYRPVLPRNPYKGPRVCVPLMVHRWRSVDQRVHTM